MSFGKLDFVPDPVMIVMGTARIIDFRRKILQIYEFDDESVLEASKDPIHGVATKNE